MTLAADSVVTIEIDGVRLDALKEYDVAQSILTQPAAFGCKTGSGTSTAALRKRFRPGMAYSLLVGETLQHSGILDEVSAGDGSGATELYLRGRDLMGAVHDGRFTAERSFSNLTYLQLASEILHDAGIDDHSVVADTVGNRAAVADVPETVLAPLLPVDAAAAARAGLPVEGPIVVGVTHNVLRCKVGETRYAFLDEQLRRAALFFYAGVGDRTFILSTVHPEQRPIYTLTRRLGRSDVKLHRFRDAAQGRFSKFTVYGRGGSGEGGRGQIKGVFVDDEMVALGFTKEWAMVDREAKTQKQADFYARRKCAETRRANRCLGYTVTGHTAPSLIMRGARHVWSPDTVVHVEDEELGLSGDFWIEGVKFRSGPSGTTTEIDLMRPEDLVFGDVTP